MKTTPEQPRSFDYDIKKGVSHDEEEYESIELGVADKKSSRHPLRDSMDNMSVISGMTGTSDSEAEDEVQNVKNLASGDTRLIKVWQFVVGACIALAGIAVSVGTYLYVSQWEQQNGIDAFVLFSNTIEDISKFHFKNMFEASRAMSRELTAEAIRENMTFPFASFPNYEVYAKQARENAGLEVISYAPVVTLSQATDFVNFSVTHQNWIEESRIMGMLLDPDLHFDNVSDTTFRPLIYDVNPLAGETFASVGDGPFTPLVHTSPPPQSLIYQLYNFASDPEYETIFGLMETYRDTMFGNTNFFLWTVVDFITGIEKHQELHDNRHKQGVDGESVEVKQPHGSLVQPVYRTLDHSSPKDNDIVGYLMGIMAFDAYLIDLLPDGVSGVYVIVENTCDSVYTYKLNGNQAQYLGVGDLHANNRTSYVNDHVRYIDFDDNYLDPTITTIPGHCVFSYRIYPSEEFFSHYTSNLPVVLACVCAVIFLVMGITLFVLLYYVEKRHSKILGEAAISNAIVSSLFPSSVRKRLFADRGALLPEEQGAASLRQFLKGEAAEEEDHGILKAKPIADLFPSATILFADIVGFTSWSSKRKPEEVFTLLETLYRSFDAAAHKAHVFKVETIGDCYVAVCGLPNPRKHHAVIMARFAQTMLSKMAVLREKLVDVLGPDTAGLAMRVGLHSGPVTAGVLRGERSRFQLFGDSVNTAARMESNGKRDRIHVSQQTANELIKANKQDWLVPRSERIVAKGKGSLQTYWVVFNGETELSEAMLKVFNGAGDITEESEGTLSQEQQPQQPQEQQQLQNQGGTSPEEPDDPPSLAATLWV